jgi:septal ring factor EnvC (AmiA/AmiB activator)
VQRSIVTETNAQRAAHRALDASLIAAAFAERRIEPRSVRAGIVARALGPMYRAEERRRALALAAAQRDETTISAEQSVLADAQVAIAQERGSLVSLLAERRSQQTRLTREATAAERQARALAAEARTLRELAARVERASRRQASPTPRGPNVVPAGWVAPAQGAITRSYGSRQAGGPAAQGVTVRTNSGAQIVSPAAGEVAYAGSFRSYGNVLILNLDGGYALVLTGLNAISVRVGDAVQAGQVVGQMSAAASSAPELYVEVRRGGQPVDPGRWLSARGLAAEAGVRAG